MPRYRDQGNMGFISTGDLSANTNIGKLVKLDASGQIVLAAAATDKVIGVLLDNPGTGQTGTVRLLSAAGTLPIQFGGNVAAGDILVSNASGQAITGTKAAAGAQPVSIVVGVALEAGATGELHECNSPAASVLY